MKIALVILHADPARGGAERYTVDLAAALRAREQEAVLVASSFPDAAAVAPSVPLSGPGATRAAHYSGFLDALDTHLATTHYDVVHAMLPVRRCDVYHPHAGLAAEAVSAGHLKHEGSIARAVSRVATRLNRRRQRFAAVERRLLAGPRPPVVLCLSEYVKRTVCRHYALEEDRLATLFNAVDLVKFDPAARPEAGRAVRERFGIGADKTVALMIAQDFARKGLREAILALAKVPDERLVLLVVGKGNPSAYRRMAEREGVAGRVVFAGPTDDPYAFYRAADAFVLPTRHDPCSLVVLEALAMAVPVISTTFNGACEVMTNGQHGFVLPDPADTEALANSLRRMLDPATRSAMSAACQALRPRLAYPQHVDNLLRIYQDRCSHR